MAGTIQFAPGITLNGLSPTARMMLQGVALTSGLPSIPVLSAHRDHTSNAAAGGAKGSQHLFGNAVDVDVSRWTDAQKQQFLDSAIANGARGVGIYSSGKTIHVDVRPNPAFWGSDPTAPYAGQPIEKAPDWAKAPLQKLFANGGGYVAPPPSIGTIRDSITAAANAFGVDPALMIATARKESGFNPNAENSRSSAKGLFGFIDQTWVDLRDKYGKKLGMPDNASPKDPKWSAVMAAAMIKENQVLMEKGIGRAPTNGELYLGQFLGGPGATSMIKAKEATPDAPAALMFADAAVANPSVFYDKDGNPRSIAQVYNLVTTIDLNAETGALDNVVAQQQAAQKIASENAQATAEARQNAAIANSVSYTPVSPVAPATQQLRPTQKLGGDMEQALAARLGNTRGGLLG